eukprot:509676_1
MRNSISCEFPPPPAPAPQLLASISRNSMNSISSYGGDSTQRPFFSFASHHHQHRHHKEEAQTRARPAQLQRNSNSYHIYDDYPRYSLPIRHEKKIRNSLPHESAGTIHTTSRSRARHSMKPKKKKKKKKQQQQRVQPFIMDAKKVPKKSCARDIEIEYEYDTDEYNEGSTSRHAADRKRYHVLSKKRKSLKIKRKSMSMRKTKKKRHKPLMIVVNDEPPMQQVQRKQVQEEQPQLSDDILMKNMMEIQCEMLSHYERIRDGDANVTNPFAYRMQVLTGDSEEKKVTAIKHTAHERIASFASSMNHHLQHYHEEEELEFEVDETLNDDALDLNDEDDTNDMTIAAPQIHRQSMNSKKIHRKTRSKSMSSIFLRHNDDDARDVLDVDDGDGMAKKHHKRKHKKHRKSSDLFVVMEDVLCRKSKKQKKRKKNKKKKCRKRDKRKRDKK